LAWWLRRPTPIVAANPPVAVSPSSLPSVAESNAQQEREDSLKKSVEQYLKESSPNPNGVEPCIDLGVLYLEQNKVSEAESLFKRMDERRPPSSYHYVGRLGLAVTDALTNNSRASHTKIHGNCSTPRARITVCRWLNDYLTKNPSSPSG